ncbi:MAG: toast rack family protein [Bryobacteraceae bacterium]|nr:toast rack family protein [Bryobacteraceae bacterium]
MTRLIIVPLVAALAGCNFHHVQTGETRTETKSIERDNAEMVRAEIKMAAGELRVTGGAAKLMDASFRYNVDAWKPDVRYEKNGFRGRLLVEQPKAGSTGGNMENNWELKFANDVPLDLSANLGAGEADLDLGPLTLRSAEMHIGAGEVKIHFSETPKRSFDLNVRGGVGEATIQFPKDVGVEARAKGGLGGIDVKGMKQDGDVYRNEAFGKSKVTITVDVKGGVGQINLIAE